MTTSAPTEAHHVDVRVVSRDPEQLAAFIALCKQIGHMSSAGSSNTIEVHVDGDGAADLRFDFGDTDVDGVDISGLDDADSRGETLSIGIGN